MSMESNTNLIESGWLYILPYLSLKKFVRIVTSYRWFYRFSLSPDIRRYFYKHNSLSWLNSENNKVHLFIEGNKNSRCIQKKNGLKVLLNDIQFKKTDYLHGYNTCNNESLNHFKMDGGITRKDLNQWQSWNSRVQFKISEYNTGKEIQIN